MVTDRQVLDTVALPPSTTPGSLSHKLLRLILSCDLSRWGFGVTSEWDIKKERRESGGRARPECGRRLELRHARCGKRDGGHVYEAGGRGRASKKVIFVNYIFFFFSFLGMDAVKH